MADAAPAVLLLGRHGDREFTGLAGRLRQLGVEVRRFFPDTASSAPLFADAGDGTIAWGEGPGFKPSVVWLRHFAVRVPRRGGDTRDEAFREQSWAALAGQLQMTGGFVIGTAAIGQLQQLAAARALGVRVPRTVVASDAEQAERLPAERYVIKALDRHYAETDEGRMAWYLPRIVERARLADGLGFPNAPVVVQEFVRHEAEVRAYLVGDELHCFTVDKKHPRHLWTRPESVGVRTLAPPSAVARAVGLLSKAWRVTYGAFDFLIDGGEPVFLEFNEHGDWCWFERRAGDDPVSRAAARTVLRLHRARVGCGQPQGFALLAFLGAITVEH